MFKGFWATACRDVPGWATYFYVYEGLKTVSFKYLNESPSKSTDLTVRLIAGGIAG